MEAVFRTLVEMLDALPDEASCIAYLEKKRWPAGPVSPFDPRSKVYRCAKGRYRCKNTGKYFTVRTGTIFEATKLPLRKWFTALYLFTAHKKGISSHQLARDLGVTQKTAWFLLHRLRYSFGHADFQQPLVGTVEADETFVGGKQRNKHKNKRQAGTQGRSLIAKEAVVGAVQHPTEQALAGRVAAEHVTSVDQRAICRVIRQMVAPGANLHTDEYPPYRRLMFEYTHRVVHHAARQYVQDGVTTNRCENFWSHLKRGLSGTYIRVSPKHLHRYLTEFTLRRNTRIISDAARFIFVLANVHGRLTYPALTTRNAHHPQTQARRTTPLPTSTEFS